MQIHTHKQDNRRQPAWPFVGRQRELDEVREALRLAASGARQIVMLVGEPGIGKTRMAEEIAAIARQRKGRVVWGRCWEGPGSPPYWPWAQILAALAPKPSGKSASTRRPSEDMAELAEIVPDLAPTRAQKASRRPGRADENRFRLFQALARFLDGAARQRPLTIVVDDLHYADKPSLAALRFLARNLRDSRILLICTYRDIEMGTSEPGAELAGEIARESRRLVLRGLSSDEVARVIREAAGTEPPGALVQAVWAKTDGNAFFVHEVVRHMLSDGALAGGVVPSGDVEVPQGVREMIRSQLARLSGPTAQVLAVASVIGRQFDAAIIREVPGIDPVMVPSSLDEAADSYLVEQVRGARDDFRFSHTLTRETIYDDLGTARRATLHQHVAQVVEATKHGWPNRVPALAHHYYEAAVGGHSVKALEFTLEAAEHSLRRLAYEEAAGYYERALTLLGPGEDQRRRAQMLLDAGEAYTRAGAITEAKHAFERCADVARTIGDATRLGQAALGYGGRIPGFQSGVVDSQLVGLIEEALESLGPNDNPLRAMLLARLSRALFYAGCEKRRLRLSQDALDMARRLDDAPALTAALNNRYWALVGPHDLPARLAVATEMGALARAIGDQETLLQSHHWRITELMQSGEMAAVRAQIEAYSCLAGELKQPLYTWFARHFRIMVATTEGRFEDSEREIHQGIDEERRVVSEFPPRMFLAQLAVLRSLQGRWQEAEALRSQSLDDSHGLASRAVAASHMWLLGRGDEARAEFEFVMAHDLQNVPRDAAWLAAVTTLAKTCAALGDVERATALYELVLPYAAYNVVTVGMFYGGPASYYLGLLAATTDQWDDVPRHFDHALDLAARTGSRPYLAVTQYEYASALLRGGVDGGLARAWDLLSKAVPTARALGMKLLARQAADLQTKIRSEVGNTVARAPVGETTPVPRGSKRQVAAPPDVIDADNALVREGDLWILRFEGVEVRLKPTKGLEYIALLLGNPDQEVHVSRLAGFGEEVWGDSGASDLIDPQAKAAYKKRVEELREELREAQEYNDAGKVSRLSDELEFLHHELAAAYGLGGRPRKLDDRTEKTRKAVGNRVRSTVARLQSQHPECARHLSTTLSLGTFCSYTPEKPTTWTVVR